MPYISKTDAFSEKFRKGGGSFSIQKFILQIFVIINGISVMNSGKKLQNSGRFATIGYLISLFDSKISPFGFFVTDEDEELGIRV